MPRELSNLRVASISLAQGYIASSLSFHVFKLKKHCSIYISNECQVCVIRPNVFTTGLFASNTCPSARESIKRGHLLEVIVK